jgi:hypothetical protein
VGRKRSAAGLAERELKAGAKLEDFAVQKTFARKSSPKKSKKRRRAKR